MSKSKNKITVVVPAYNRANVITRLLDSLAHQQRRPDEVIIVDDGSEDETATVTEHWLAAHPTVMGRLLRQSNHGAAHARNAGLRAASAGEMILFVDSDDVLPPDFFARTEQIMLAQPDVVAVSVDQTFRQTDGREEERSLRGITKNPEEWLFLGGAGVASCTLLRARAVLATEGFDECLYTGHDVPFFIAMARQGSWCHAPGAPVIMWREAHKKFNLFSFCDDSHRRWAFIYEDAFKNAGAKRRWSDKRWRNLGWRWYIAGRHLREQHRYRDALYCFGKALWWTPYRWRAGLCAARSVAKSIAYAMLTVMRSRVARRTR